MASKIPAEPPPPYEAAATGSSSTAPQPQDPSRLAVPHKTRSGIPPQYRRSMEDESRPLPTGWVRQYDSKSHHQFFVDERVDPPRRIWHHPYDDEQYMTSLTPAERERIEGLHRVPTRADIEAESSEDDSHAPLPPRPQEQGKGKGKQTFGRKMKDKLTNTTHEEREASRRQREEDERKAYAQHQAIRRAMSKAMETGQPQLLGKDPEGKDVYVEPPSMQGGFGGYGGRGYGYNPYQNGMYTTPNARYLRPDYGYDRPYGYGYGGGLGMPLLGGLGGGLLLGGMLF